MKRFTAWLLTLALLLSCCPFMPLQASAEAVAAATITFDDEVKRVTLTDEQQVWQENGITLTNNKANATAAINGNYFAPIRMYAKTEFVLEYPGMVGFDMDCNYTTYSNNLIKTLDTVADPGIASYTVDGNVVSVQFVSAMDSFTLALTTQVRANSITVYTAGEDIAEPSEPETPDTPDVPEEPSVTEEPETPTVPDADGTVLTIAEAIAMGTAMEHNTYSEVNYKVTGVISEVYNTTYGNMKLTDDAGNLLTIYGTYDATGENRYDAMEVKPVAGDTVTIYGPVGQYNGTPQIKNGWIVEHTPAVSEPEVPEEPVEPEVSAITYVDMPVADTAYKFVMNQVTVGKHMGFTGAMSGYYYATSDVIAEMIDVYLETAEIGYCIYFKDEAGEKVYLNVIPRETDATKVNVVLQTVAENAAPSVYQLNTEFKYVKTAVNEVEWFLGTYGTYTTVSASKTSYIEDTSKIGVSQFPVWFATVGETETPDTPDVPDVPEVPSVPDEPEVPVAPTVVDAPVAGTAYKFGMTQGNLENKLYYITGAMNGYYMDTVEDAAAAADVYLEETTDGYYLYTNVDGAKKYINMVISGTHVNGAFEDAAATVYTYDAEAKTVIATVNDAPYWFGTRNDKTYTTVGPVKTEYQGFYCQFYIVTESENPETPDVPDVPEEPSVPEEPETPEVPEEPVGNGVTITFDDVAKRVTLTDEQQVWQENGITVTNNKGASTTNVNGKYFDPVRFYKNSDVIVEYPGMIRLDIDAGYATYMNALVQSLEGMENVNSITTDGYVVSIALIKAVDSFAFTASAGQCRVNSITVYAGEGTETPDEPTVPEEPEDPTTPEAPEVTVGMLDGIAGFTEDDAIHLLHHVLMPGLFEIDQPVDFDGDGAVTVDDAVYLLCALLFPEYYPL